MAYIKALGAAPSLTQVIQQFKATTSTMTPAQKAQRMAAISAVQTPKKKCVATGMPPQFIQPCIEGLQSGASIEDVLSVLQSGAGGAAPPQGEGARESIVDEPKSRLLLYGGIAAAAGLGIFLFVRRRK